MIDSSLIRFRFVFFLALASALPVLRAYGQGAAQPKTPDAKLDAKPTSVPSGKPTFVLKQFTAGRPLRLIAYGDMRFTDPVTTSGTDPRLRQWLAEKIGAEKPQALLITGDMPMVGDRQADWDEYQKETASWKAAGFPVFPTLGNHEIYHDREKGIANYLNNYPELKQHRWYSALLGSVEVISLDMNAAVGPRSEQGRWFAAQLDRIPDAVEFLLILYHIPWVADTQSQLVASLPTHDAVILRTMVETRVPKMHAKVVVFSGHIHNYERFEQHGVEYVVTGGGGAVPYPILYRGTHDLYRDSGFPVYHYLTIEVHDHQLQGVMWKVIDPSAATLNVEAKDNFIVKANPSLARVKK
jgi:hypothetical protein